MICVHVCVCVRGAFFIPLIRSVWIVAFWPKSCDTLNNALSKVELHQLTRCVDRAGGSVPAGFCSLSEEPQL